jgi:cytochrome c-type biogenesis protein CcmH
MPASSRAVLAISALALCSVAVSMTAGALLTRPGPAAPAAASNPANERPDPEAIVARVEALERRLEANPDDLDGWKMLGRSFMALDRPREAVGAWSRAAQIAPSDPDVRRALAQLMDLARRSGAHEEGSDKPAGELSPSR